MNSADANADAIASIAAGDFAAAAASKFRTQLKFKYILRIAYIEKASSGTEKVRKIRNKYFKLICAI